MFAKSTKYEGLYTVYWYAKLLVCDCDICHYCKGLEQAMYQEPSALLKRLSRFSLTMLQCPGRYTSLRWPANTEYIYIYMYLRLIEAPDHHMAHRRRRPIPVGMWEKNRTNFIKLTIHDFESGSWTCSPASSWPSSFVSTTSLLGFLGFLAAVLPSAFRFAAARPQSHAEFGMRLKWDRQLLQCDNYI